MDRENILAMDPYMLLSYINTKLRDEFESLKDLCYAFDVNAEAIENKLREIGYKYNAKTNQFVSWGDTMIAAFLIGLFIAGLGIILSIAIGNFQLSFALSGTAGVISLVISSMIGNMAVISRSRMAKKKEEDGEEKNRLESEGKNWARAVSLFGFPNIVVAIIMFFKLYK